MGKACAYCGALNKQKAISGITHHKFPPREDPSYEIWLRNMGLGSSFIPNNNSRLCSEHFEKKCFQEGTNNARLRPGSVPTLFGQYKAVCAFCHALKDQYKSRTFRRFPLKNPAMLKKWLEAMDLKDFTPNEKSLLCDDHFERNCFRLKGRNQNVLALKANAIPTIFLLRKNKEIGMKVQENTGDLIEVLPSEIMEVDDPALNETTRWTICQKRIEHSSSEKSSSKISKAGGSDDQSFSSSSPIKEEIGSIHYTPPASPTTFERRLFHLHHDHQYETSPSEMKKKITCQKIKIQKLLQEAHVSRQRISRLMKRVTSLKEIIQQHSIPVPEALIRDIYSYGD